MATLMIVLACDQGYAMQLATTLRSIVEANQRNWPLDFSVLTDGFPKEIQNKVVASLPEGSATIRWIPVSLDLFRDFSTVPGVSTMTYARLLIPRVIPDSVSKVLYLDSDILVLADLQPLWETDLEGAPLGAVMDRLDQRLKCNDPTLKKLPEVRNYFNAGVLLIDLQRWRMDGISERAMEYLIAHPNPPNMDQDALNAACDCSWKKVDSRWNFQDHFENAIVRMRSQERPAIVHFVTSSKPWQPRCNSVNASFYDSYRKKTRFARTKREIFWDALLRSFGRLERALNRNALPPGSVE